MKREVSCSRYPTTKAVRHSNAPFFRNNNMLERQQSSCSNLDNYAVPAGMNGQTALAGSYDGWTLVEVEVYQVYLGKSEAPVWF
eukprot:g45575.t1